jgi:hypothetical protein
MCYVYPKSSMCVIQLSDDVRNICLSTCYCSRSGGTVVMPYLCSIAIVSFFMLDYCVLNVCEINLVC